jgi:hypothetical protein
MPTTTDAGAQVISAEVAPVGLRGTAAAVLKEVPATPTSPGGADGRRDGTGEHDAH